MANQRLAVLALGLIAVLGLTACANCNPCNQPNPCNTPNCPNPCNPCNTAPPPCDPCAPPPCDPCAPPPCDPCAPMAAAPCDPCAPVAQAPCDPCGQPPPSANAGEVWCYVRIPAVTKTVEEQVCIQPATCRQEWVPPVTEQIQEQVCVKPEECRRIPIPARYETVCEQVMTCPGRTEWQRVNCEPSSLNQGEQLGECWSLVEIPPVYETRSKQVCVSPESCREEIIPAQYEMRCKTVTKCEGYYKNIDVPPVYETRCKEVEVCPPRWEWRRTHECEVPCAPPAGNAGFAPAPAPMGQPAPMDAFGSPDTPAPYPANTAPAAGAADAGQMPAADPFAPQR